MYHDVETLRLLRCRRKSTEEAAGGQQLHAFSLPQRAHLGAGHGRHRRRQGTHLTRCTGLAHHGVCLQPMSLGAGQCDQLLHPSVNTSVLCSPRIGAVSSTLLEAPRCPSFAACFFVNVGQGRTQQGVRHASRCVDPDHVQHFNVCFSSPYPTRWQWQP